MIEYPNSASLYKIDFQNGKSYIGITTKTVEKRFVQHCKLANKDSPVHAVHRAIKYHGVASVKVTTIAIGNVDYILASEKRAISVFNTKSPFGYNMTEGGDGVVNSSYEVRSKISLANIGKKMSDEAKKKISIFNKGKVVSQETKNKIRDAQVGRVFSDEQKKNIGLAHAGKTLSSNTRKKISEKLKGKVVSAETREKLSAAKKGKLASAESRMNQSISRTGMRQSKETKEKRSLSLKLAYLEGRRSPCGGRKSKKDLQD